MNDENLIREIYSSEKIEAYKEIKKFQNQIGISLENYINSFEFPEGIRFVGRDRHKIEGVDYVVNDEHWSIKNAWNTDNSSTIKFREDRDIKHWYRLNKDNSTNWHTFFITGPSERGFIDFLGGKQPSSLEAFFN